MDKTLDLKLEEFKKTLAALKEALDKDKDDIVRDSVIKRFEFTFESCWKTAKVFLNDKFGINVFSPKETFRELGRNKLVSAEKVEILLELTDKRNEAIHTYSETFLDELYDKIGSDYYSLMTEVFEVLKSYKQSE